MARKFKPSDKNLADTIDLRLTEIFAEDQDALALIDAPSGVEMEVTVKTVQGEYSTQSPIYGYEEPDPFTVFSTAYPSYGRRRVVVDYKTVNHLTCGLELVKL